MIKKLSLYLLSSSVIANSLPQPFIGIDAGLLDANTKIIDSNFWSGGAASTTHYLNNKGAIGSLKAGLNKSYEQWEGSVLFAINYANISSNAGTEGEYLGNSYYDKDSSKMDYYYSFLWQLGYCLTDFSNIFFQAGAALAKYTFAQNIDNTFAQPFNYTIKPNIWGLDLGLGFKQKLTPKVNLILLGEYIHFVKQKADSVYNLDGDSQNDYINYYPVLMMVKIGLEYKFNV